ncbi:MAG: hypothetical protein PHO66_08575, partial [Eubacteriales bacterium]|nr:hypothetical protein [Eubacteriales bacterium]
WIGVTFARCHMILAADAPARQRALWPAFADMLAQLGLSSAGDFARRAREGLAYLPYLQSVADEIMARNSDIRDE